MVAPAGAPESRLKERLFAGKSGSVAEAVKVSRLPSSNAYAPIAASTGAMVDFVDRDRDGLEVFQARHTVVSDPHGHRVVTRRRSLQEASN